VSEKTDATPKSEISVSEKWQERFELFERIGADDTLISKFFGTPAFKELDSKEKKSIKWNSLAIVFGPLYYFCKGMWQKGAVLLGVVWLFAALLTLIETAIGKSMPALMYWLPSAIICGQLASFDYYRHVKHGDRTWSFMPGFLSTTGGAIACAVGAFILLCAVESSQTGITTEELADMVVAEILQSELVGDGLAKSKDAKLVLVHVRDNEYKGVLSYTMVEMMGHGIPSTNDVKVLYDGESFFWEIIGSTVTTKELADMIVADMQKSEVLGALLTQGKDVKFDLERVSDNKYKGMLELTIGDNPLNNAVEVFYDGESFSWELLD